MMMKRRIIVPSIVLLLLSFSAEQCFAFYNRKIPVSLSFGTTSNTSSKSLYSQFLPLFVLNKPKPQQEEEETTEQEIIPRTIRLQYTNRRSKRNLNREAAGAESMFSTAKFMREKQFQRLTQKWKSRWGARLFSQQQRRRLLRLLWRQQQQQQVEEKDQKDTNNASDNDDDDDYTSKIAQMDIWGVEKARKNLSIPSWSCNDIDEERRLAAMKIILEDDLKEVALKEVTMENGTVKKKMKVVVAFPDVYSDFRLLRFLRKDKIQDPVAAAVRYQEFLKWRQENNIDDIRAMVEYRPYRPPSEWTIVGDHLPCDFFQGEPTIVQTTIKSSKKGVKKIDDTISSSNLLLPILLRVNLWDTASISKLIRSGEIPLSTFLNYWAYIFESMHMQLYDKSMVQKQMVYADEICDFTSSTLMKQFTPLFISTLLKPWMEMTQSNYPETTKRIVMLNPPSVLKLIWNVVAPLASPSTVAKVRLHPGFEGTSHDFVSDHHPNVNKY